MKAALVRLWRRLFKPDAAPTAALIPAEKARRPQWDRIIGAIGNDPDSARVELKMPDVLPGVRPAKYLPKEQTEGDGGVVLAMDSGGQEMLALDAPPPPAAWGFGDAGLIGPGLAFLGFPYLAELAQISEYRIPAESLSTEMTRRWMRLRSKGKKEDGDSKAEKIRKIEERFEALKVRDLFREAALKTEQFGRAHIYISIKGQDEDRPRQLPLTKIEKGTLLGFSCIEPYWLTPYSWNSTHPERSEFYKPQSWFVLGRKTHSTRLLTFIFREVPDLLKPAYDFAGISITQLMMPYVNRWLRTAKSVNDLINIFSVVTLATDLAAMLQAPVDAPEGLLSRLRGFTQLRDNKGLMAINKGTEELSMQNVPLSSLDKLQAQAQEHMATPARMTLLKFFGVTPSGLNATAEPEQEAWNDYVHALQEIGFSKHMERVLQFVQMDLFGSIDDEITYEWLSLYEPTGKEKAEIRKADADRDAVYLTNNVIAPEEIRERLQMDPESGYDNLDGPAPEPPEVTEFDLGEKSADNDQQRGEESAEAAHERAKELEKNKPKPGKD